MKNLFTLFTLILFVNQINGQLATASFTNGSTILTPGVNIASARLLSVSTNARDCANAIDNARLMNTTDMSTIILEITPNPGFAITAITDLYIDIKIGEGDCAVMQDLEAKVRPMIDGFQTAPDQLIDENNCGHLQLVDQAAAPAPFSSPVLSSLSTTNSTIIEIMVFDFNCSGSKTVVFDEIIVNGFMSALLPVDLTKFDIKKTQKSIMLSWATASEKNNDHFDIQKSSNGTHFQTIGQVKGNGTTATGAHYNFEDNTPSVGVAYYRLKQVDINGKFDYSKVQSIRFDNNKLVVAPTLAKESISLTVSNDAIVPFEIVNLNGQKVLAGKANGQQTIDVSGLHSGMYFIRTEGGETARFVKE